MINTKVTAKDVIEILLNEDGYFGKKYATDNLDVKEAPNGTGEYTKYARDMFAGGYYNGNKNGYDGHCTIFIDWAMYMAQGCPKRSELDNNNCLNPLNDCGAGAPWNAGCYSYWGLLDQNPKVGDKIFLCEKNADGTPGKAYHVGLVYAMDGDTLYTMEGNTINAKGEDNAYCKKVRTLDKSYMMFGHPRYYIEEEDPIVVELKKRVAVLEEENARLQIKADKYDAIKAALS